MLIFARTASDRKRPAAVARRLRRALLVAGLLALAAGGRASAEDDCPDALITADVKSRLMARHPVAALRINVETDQCVVTLKGCVETAQQRKEAVKSARKVTKVRAVKDQMTLCPKDKD
ncbi:MAG TPA: BON domain-containing protein [Candidatus Polarisedimenticolia bacterium]|nr:BON domain-containing protein [Candidatus Polarisedimenticolia bacterium]